MKDATLVLSRGDKVIFEGTLDELIKQEETRESDWVDYQSRLATAEDERLAKLLKAVLAGR
jgi:hypothetical protein